MWFYHVSRTVVKVIMLLFTRSELRGREHLPAKGPVLVVANHLNNADPPILAVALRRTAIFMAKEELFKPKLSGYFIGSFGAFPVKRGQLDRKALRQAEQCLSEEKVLVMFPEGQRSTTGQLGPALPGSALVALKCGSPVLPVAISGTESITGAFWWLRRPHVTVTIGVPFKLASPDGKVTKPELNELTSVIMSHIAELLPPAYQGEHSNRKPDEN